MTSLFFKTFLLLPWLSICKVKSAELLGIGTGRTGKFCPFLARKNFRISKERIFSLTYLTLHMESPQGAQEIQFNLTLN